MHRLSIPSFIIAVKFVLTLLYHGRVESSYVGSWEEGGECKPGVTGDNCDACLPGHWDFNPSLGCRNCQCLPDGSPGNAPSCRQDFGECTCKQNVEGRRCNRCKAGFFNLSSENDQGCTPCNCYPSGNSLCSLVDGRQKCDCPPEYAGDLCERCQEGYFHEHNGGPEDRCVECRCNGHADTCDGETGVCECRDNTAGPNCDTCRKGYYGNALAGTTNDCKECPCPDGGACLERFGDPDSPVCTECPERQAGLRCEVCDDGFFGDPVGRHGPIRSCQPCDCNGNVWQDSIGNCDRNTGECLRCIDNTEGFNCERCKPGFFGDALAAKAPGDPPSCQPCSHCYFMGTQLDMDTFLPVCDASTGDCTCRSNVVGRNCDDCEEGYSNLDSGIGCEATV